MNWRKIIFAFGGMAVVLGLAGCERDPRDIAKWKAEGNTGKLISATGDPRQFVRIDAIEALAELQSKEAIEPLAALFSDSDMFIAHKAIDAVASINDPRVEKHMITVLDFKTSEARTTAATTLGRLKSEAAVDPLIAALDDDYESVVEVAVTALGQIGNPKAVGPLSKKINSRSFNIRIASVTSLKQIGGPAGAKGLEPAMGSMSEKVRNAAVAGLIEIGPASAPYARNALRSGNHFKRASGVAVLQGLNDVPATGSDKVWYQLANLTSGDPPVVDPAIDTGLAHIENMDVLMEALVHEQRVVRDYALLALAAIGEPAAAPALAAAEQNIDMEAKMWLNGRSRWSGAPAWQIDLWAAATTLNPGFKINAGIISDLKPHSQSAEKMMKSERFKPRREYIPLLIVQFATLGSKAEAPGSKPATDDSQLSLFGVGVTSRTTPFTSGGSLDTINRERAKRCRQLAAEQLIEADYEAVLPLLAALKDDDLDSAFHSTRTLIRICGEQAEEPVVAAFSTRLDNGEEISVTMLQDIMQELGTPAAEALLLKVRPNVDQAIKTAERKYPEVEFSNIPIEVDIDPNLKAAPFRLVYLAGDRKKELRIIFRPNENGDWVPSPPLPDAL